MVSSISREYVNMCLTGLPFRFRWALNQVFSSRLWLHSHHSKLSSPKSEANIQTFLGTINHHHTNGQKTQQHFVEAPKLTDFKRGCRWFLLCICFVHTSALALHV